MRHAERLVTAVLVAALVGPALAAVGSVVLPALAGRAEQRGMVPEAVLAGLAIAGVVGFGAVARRVGPVAASGAERQWRWTIDPSAEQRHRTGAVALVGSAVIAAACVPVPFLARELGWAMPWSWSLAFAVLLLVAGLAAVLHQRGGTGLIAPWRLSRAARRQEAVMASLVLADPEIVAVYRAADDATSRRRLAARTMRSPVRVLAIRCLREARGPLLAGAALTGLAGAVLGTEPATVVAVVGLAVVVARLSRPARALVADPGLARSWAPRGGLERAARLVPVVAGIALALVASAALATSWSSVTGLVALPVLVAWRRIAGARVPEPALVSTPAGAVPLDVVARLAAGPDVTVLVLVFLAA